MTNTPPVDVIATLREAWQARERAEIRSQELTVRVYELEEENILLRQMAGVDDDD